MLPCRGRAGMLPLPLVLVSAALTLADPGSSKGESATGESTATPAGKGSKEDTAADMAQRAREKAAEKVFKSPFMGKKAGATSKNAFGLPPKKPGRRS